MKKISAIFAGLALLWSCETHDAFEPENTVPLRPGITIKNGVLSFESIDAYKSLVNEAPIAEKNSLVSLLNERIEYTSLKKIAALPRTNSNGRELGSKTEDISASNDFISSILNENGIVAIGDYFFKVNFETEKVYALQKTFIGQLSDLENEVLTNANLLEFTTSDDVLAIIESGDLRERSGGRSEILCFREGGADARDSKHEEIEIVSNGSAPTLAMNADMKHVYQKAGIYFSLMLEMKYMWKRTECGAISCYQQLSTEIWANGTYRMRQKCKSNDTGYQSFGFWIDSNKLNHRFWENSSALQVMYLDTEFTWIHVGYNTSLPVAKSDDDLPLFFQRQTQRSYHLDPIYDNI